MVSFEGQHLLKVVAPFAPCQVSLSPRRLFASASSPPPPPFVRGVPVRVLILLGCVGRAYCNVEREGVTVRGVARQHLLKVVAPSAPCQAINTLA